MSQTMTTQAARIGKWKGEILARAIPCEVLQLTASQKQMPRNVSDTVIYRRWVPYNATVANPNILIQDVSPASTVETDASNRVATRTPSGVGGSSRMISIRSSVSGRP